MTCSLLRHFEKTHPTQRDKEVHAVDRAEPHILDIQLRYHSANESCSSESIAIQPLETLWWNDSLCAVGGAAHRRISFEQDNTSP
jgi:hypothetical protein